MDLSMASGFKSEKTYFSRDKVQAYMAYGSFRNMPATNAERQRKHREKLKREAPEQYEEKKRKRAEYMKNKRKTIGELTDTEKKRRRQQWQQANQRRRDKKIKIEKSHINLGHIIKRNTAILNEIAYTIIPTTSIRKKYVGDAQNMEKQEMKFLNLGNMPATSAERQRKHREKLKKETPEQYEEKKRKHAEYMRNNRKTIRELTETEKKRRRQQWQQANQRRRDKKIKLEKSQLNSRCIIRNTVIMNEIANFEKYVVRLLNENSTLKKTVYRQNITIKRLKENLALGQN